MAKRGSKKAKKIIEKSPASVSKYKKDGENLKSIGWKLSDLMVERNLEECDKKPIPTWFYVVSIFSVFLFTAYISVFASIHFEDIRYMSITIVLLFLAMVTFFLISAAFFFSEKKMCHSIASALFFIGVAFIMIYAFKAVDSSNMVRFSIIYTIIVATISAYILVIKR